MDDAFKKIEAVLADLDKCESPADYVTWFASAITALFEAIKAVLGNFSKKDEADANADA